MKGNNLDSNFLLNVHKASLTGILQLSGLQITNEICDALPNVLSEFLITSMDFTDCMLTQECLFSILRTLKDNERVTELNLYGNNISGQSTVKLGQFLAENKSVKNLILKWNNIGVSIESFSIFCNYLKSSVLEQIDLRNNQICQEGAKCLANVISENQNLQIIDLRWNSIQSEGAERILEALRTNGCLTTVLLKGNRINREIMVAIEESLKNHSIYQKLNTDHEIKAEMLLQHIKEIENARVNEVSKTKLESDQKLEDAQNTIKILTIENEEKLKKVSKLENEMFTLKLNYKKEQQKSDSLQNGLKDCENNLKDSTANYQSIIEGLKISLHERELDEQKHKSFSQEQLNSDKSKILKLENELFHEKETAESLRVEIASLKNKYEGKIREGNEILEDEKEMWKKKYLDLQTDMDKELHRYQNLYFEKQQALESHIIEITARHSEKLADLTEKLEKITNEKKLLEERFLNVQDTAIQLQKENSLLISQMAEPARKLTEILDELTDERIANQKVKQALIEETNTKEQIILELNKSKTENTLLKTNIENNEMKNEEIIKELKSKCKQLQNKLEEKSKKIIHLKNEEKERNKFLQAAFNKYFNKLDLSSKSPNTSADS